MICIAVTGGIACGKSLAGSHLAAAGWSVCEADEVAHGLYAPGGPAYDDVCALAGKALQRPDGSLDRRQLAGKVFASARLRADLNALLHPLVAKEIARWRASCAQAGVPGAAAIVPLLFEAGMAQGWDAVVSIGCRADVQHQRLVQRGLDEAAIAARLAAQWPLSRKMAAADFAIWNDGSPCELRIALDDVIRQVAERK